jgi:hypothetical protein
VSPDVERSIPSGFEPFAFDVRSLRIGSVDLYEAVLQVQIDSAWDPSGERAACDTIPPGDKCPTTRG